MTDTSVVVAKPIKYSAAICEACGENAVTRLVELRVGDEVFESYKICEADGCLISLRVLALVGNSLGL